ncbi:hypothetical protein V5799_034452 [Amblyomma americanum]|uniref:GH18 domain-containing protein n=1 Tax=Amblyomma americanum TaxID=6943 RepID=A0AAQ4DKE8_AMBAM
MTAILERLSAGAATQVDRLDLMSSDVGAVKGAIRKDLNTLSLIKNRTPGTSVDGIGTKYDAAETSKDILVRVRQSQSREHEESEEHERFCLTVWLLCGILLFPLILSVWLFLVPFLMDIERTTMSEAPSFPRTSRLPTGATSIATTDTSTQSTPPPCMESVVLPTLPTHFQIGPTYNSTTPTSPSRPFFCLFNSSRVVPDYNPLYTGTSWNYMFQTLPFSLCPNILYWSVGVENGTITSRMPAFDAQHGLSQLRTITDAQGYPDIKLLLALGGYPEDSPHFTRIVQDPAMLQRLMDSVVNAMQNFRLDGVTVDWVEPKPGCENPDDLRLLGELLRNIRSTFNSQGFAHAITSVILDVNAANEHLVDSVYSEVNYFFLATHRVRLPRNPSMEHLCANITSLVHSVLERYARIAQRISVQQLCITEYAAPMVSEGRVDPATGAAYFEPSMKFAPIYLGCAHSSFCREANGTGSCIVHRVLRGPPDPSGTPAMRFVVSSDGVLSFRANLYGGTCVLVLGLDYDNFVDQCGSRFRRYLLMEHMYSAMTSGQAVTTRAIVDGAPTC